MTALVILLMFVAFATIDWLLHRKQVPVTAPVPLAAEPVAVAEPVFVGGYQLPDELHYHPGHVWARIESPEVAAVGLDDFASKLTGRAKGVRLPAVGDWVHAGSKTVRIDVDGRHTEFVSPLEGEVVEVNPELRKEPAVSTWDPYRRGWLFKVRTPQMNAGLRNLLHGRLARTWMEDASQQLQLRLMALSGSVLQDGGVPAPDFARHLDAAEWKRRQSAPGARITAKAFGKDRRMPIANRYQG